jgi:hypothetical protein
MTEDDDDYVGGSGGTKTPAALGCDPLPAPTGSIVSVTPAQSAELPNLVATAASGTTLVLEPGTYIISQELVFAVQGVTLRSATNDPASVTIDGQRNTNLIRVNASNVTLAHVTLTRALEIAVLLEPGPGITGFSMHDVRIIDGGQEFLRAAGSPAGYVDSGSITCSDFQLTGELRADVCCPGCVLLGMNIVGGRDWVVRGSRFQELNCGGNTPQAPPFAVLFRGGVRDALIENNSFWNPERGLGLGFDTGTDPQRDYSDAPYGGLALDFIDGIVRNNVIFSNQSSFDTGIEINDAREPIVIHNTVVYTDGYRSIDWRYADTQAIVANNLVRAMGPRNDATATTTTNLENTPLEYFVDPTGFDLHLAPGATGAIDQGTSFPEAGMDLDGEPHGATPDIGADER